MKYRCKICNETYSQPVGQYGKDYCVHCYLALVRVMESDETRYKNALVTAGLLAIVKMRLQDDTGFVVPSVVAAAVLIIFKDGIL